MGTKRKVIATIEARMGSSRLPGKTLKAILGRPMLELLIERVKACRTVDQVVVATTTAPEDQAIEDLARRLGVGCHRGSSDDVLKRVLEAAQRHGGEVIAELTGDCPLLDPAVTDQVIQVYLDGGHDYVSNNLVQTFPMGLETKVFSTDALAEVDRITRDPYDHEHVSLYFYEKPGRYRLFNVAAPVELARPEVRLTVDTLEDFTLISRIYEALYRPGRVFPLGEALEFLDENPEVVQINERIKQKPARPQ